MTTEGTTEDGTWVRVVTQIVKINKRCVWLETIVKKFPEDPDKVCDGLKTKVPLKGYAPKIIAEEFHRVVNKAVGIG